MDWRDEIRERFPDWGEDAALASWPSTRSLLCLGQTVRGEVIARAPFGVWIDIAVKHPALLLVPDMEGVEQRRIKFEDFPAIGSILEARIAAIGDRCEITVSQRQQSAPAF